MRNVLGRDEMVKIAKDFGFAATKVDVITVPMPNDWRVELSKLPNDSWQVALINPEDPCGFSSIGNIWNWEDVIDLLENCKEFAEQKVWPQDIGIPL